MTALIIIDIQNDFLPGGALAVPEGDLIIPTINALIPAYDLVVATQDWHPADHGSFATTPHKVGDCIDLHGLPQTLWPTHCVQGTVGAEFAETLDLGAIDAVVQKGTDPTVDSYSGFFDNGQRQATGLHEYLQNHQITAVHIVGVATDYCVKFTALDALRLGYQTTILTDACRGVDLHPGDTTTALKEIHNAGGQILPNIEPAGVT